MNFDDVVIVHDHPMALHYCSIKDSRFCSWCKENERLRAEYIKTCPTCSAEGFEGD